MILRWIWRFLIWNAAFACQLPRKSQPVCHAAPEKRWAATRRLNVGIQSEDSEDEWMAEWQICFCKFSYEFCLCSVLSISWSCLSKKAWESANWIHDSSLFTQHLHRSVGNLLSHWVCNTDPQGSQAAPRLQHQWGDSIPERWPLWAWRRLSSLSCFGLNV